MIYSYQKDGITQSLLGTWMTCRKKAFWYLQGYSLPQQSPALTYGTIIHSALEAHYGRKDINLFVTKTNGLDKILKTIEGKWYVENKRPNRFAIESFESSILIAQKTLPIYFDYWRKEDTSKLAWRALEQEFAIPYTDARGRRTFIRGKIDGVLGKLGVKLFETKTKSMFNEEDLVDTLWFELQVNVYLWALKKLYKTTPSGVLYNIIRKPGLRRNIKEALVQFGERVAKDIAKRPEHYFIRMEVAVSPLQQKAFENELDEMITDFLDWCDDMNAKSFKNTHACIDKYGKCQYLELCSKGNFNLYNKRKTMFSELGEI